MAEKKIIWKQKTGASTFDILYPQTTADQVKYNDTTVADALANIGTDLDKKFVTLDTEQTIEGIKAFRHSINVISGVDYPPLPSDITHYLADKIVLGEGTNQIYFPQKSGTLLVDGDIPNVEVAVTGNGNAITAASVDTTNKHKITFTKGTTFATTATATQSANGLMSSTDKKNLDDMVTLFGTTVGDTDAIVNTVRELLSIFDEYPEGTTITQALAGKADKSALDNYVTLDTQQTITGKKTFENEIAFGKEILISNPDEDGEPYIRIFGDKFIISGTGEELSEQTVLFPSEGGTLALLTDIPSIPTSLPPTGAAGGDLTGTYPNPTIGAGKVTESKIGALAVTEGKIATNAVTSEKIAGGAVTDGKLSTTGVTAGTYSIVAVSSKGRVTAGSNLFTIGTATTIPSSVSINAFYLQDVTEAA